MASHVTALQGDARDIHSEHATALQGDGRDSSRATHATLQGEPRDICSTEGWCPPKLLASVPAAQGD